MDTELKQAATIAELKAQTASLASDDAERLIATGEKLLRAQQARLLAGWANHELRRTERSNWYRGQMQKLADDAEQELHALDQTWAVERQHIEEMIGKLKALRGVR